MARKKRQRRSRENSSMYPNPGRGGYGQHKKKNHWENFKKNSESFERFYKAQQIVPEEEFPLFVNAMKQDLPSTFRITGTRSHAHELLQVMRKLLDDLLNVNSDGATVNPPTPLPWYPDDLAWQVNFTKKFIRKSSCMSKFHQFLVHETESGNISRQEAVSMIPPLLLDVKPGQKILDACAAPGSKTVQLIELLHDDDSSGIPDGLVVANELQNRRCYMLVHQSKRLHSPCCVITNHDAAMFPEMFVKGKDGSKSPLQFDRILCDVPCSGDGTMRKNPLIWRKWTPILGLGLHRLQLRILTRAVEMLATGGRIVYSTCTMNPIENEAVICTLLQKAEGSLELVDVSSELHGLKRSPGLMSWKLMTKTMEVVDNCDPGTEHYSKGFKPQMLAPPEEVIKELHIERCIRVYPHQQDTGGFFIAVIEKKRPARWENENRFSENRRLLPWETEADWQSKMREKANAYSLREKSQKPSLDDNQGELGGSGESESKMMDTASSQDEEASTSDHVTEINSELRTRSDNDDDSGDNDDDIEGVGAFNKEQPELIEIVEGDKGEGNVIELDESDEAVGCDVNEEDDSAARAACSTKNDNNGGEIPGDSAAQEEGQPPRKKAKVDRGFKEDPFVFLEEGDEHWAQIKQFYGIDESFPVNQLLVRSVEGKKRNIYFVSKAVRDVMELVDDRVKVVNTGMKVITRSEADGVGCCFRLMQEGIEVLLPFIHKRKVLITQKDMIILLTEDRPFFTELSSTTREQFDRIEGMGCIVYLYEPNGPYSKSEDTIGCRILFCGWKARVSTRVQISKFHRFHYMTLCGIPPGQKMKQSPLETNQEAPAEVDDEAKEIAPEKTEEEPEKTDEDEDHPGYLGDILNVEVPEGALDVGFI